MAKIGQLTFTKPYMAGPMSIVGALDGLYNQSIGGQNKSTVLEEERLSYGIVRRMAQDPRVRKQTISFTGNGKKQRARHNLEVAGDTAGDFIFNAIKLLVIIIM